MTMGHEFMGIVEDVGRDVQNLKKGDRVVVPFPIACGQCWFCTRDYPTLCERSNPNYGPEGGLLNEKGGALFGYTDLYGGFEGGQAEAVRVPYADYGPRKVPESLSDEQVLFLTDIFPTGWTAVDMAQLKDGDTVAVFGSGPVGIMAMKAAWLQGAGRVIAVDLQGYRLEMARKAANVSETIDADDEDPVERIRELTNGRGADVCIDAVGMEAEHKLGVIARVVDVVVKHQAGSLHVFEKCMSAVRRGGTVSVVGVYATTHDNFPLGQMFDKGVKVWGGQAPVHKYIDKLIGLVESGKVRLDDIITHTLPLDEAPHGYDIFNKKEDDCVKVVLKP
jgi:alcohol dehydrogenase